MLFFLINNHCNKLIGTLNVYLFVKLLAYKFFTDSVVPGCNFPAFACESYEKLLEGDCFPCVDGNCANMG